MVKLGHLFNEKHVDCPEWEETKESVKNSIDSLMEKGTVDQETLVIMKELLDLSKPITMKSYLED